MSAINSIIFDVVRLRFKNKRCMSALRIRNYEFSQPLNYYRLGTFPYILFFLNIESTIVFAFVRLSISNFAEFFFSLSYCP